MTRLFLCIAVCFTAVQLHAQNADSIKIRRIFDEALLRGQSYQTLEVICKSIGARLSGSLQAEKAVSYTAQQMYAFGFDTVYLQPVVVPHWVRGDKEVGSYTIGATKRRVRICALGMSVATDSMGVTAPVIEVHSLKELAVLGRERIQGKIVFFNRPLDPTHISTGRAYGGAGDQRGRGPTLAAYYGAVGAIVRSLTLSLDTFPHTGMTHYLDSIRPIPACAISTVDANALSDALQSKDSSSVRFYFKQNCQNYFFPALSYNVIGEIRGTEKPNEVIVVGGHLDSWDLGEGAQDDGAGVVQSMEALRLIKMTGLKPKRTIRCVLFMNEENGVKGGIAFGEEMEKRKEKEKVIVAIESDGGGYTPRGFGIENSPAAVKSFQKWVPLLDPYGITYIREGHGGTDIEPLAKGGTICIGYICDSQRYFDVHHTAADTFDKVHKRELELGAASISALIWLISEYGVK